MFENNVTIQVLKDTKEDVGCCPLKTGLLFTCVHMNGYSES